MKRTLGLWSLLVWFLAPLALAVPVERKLVMIAGPASHPPLMHEFRAGSILLQKRLEKVPGLRTVLVTQGWPTKMVNGERVDDFSVFDGADAIFIYSDGGAKHLALQGDRREFLRGLMARGVSLGCAHYAVEVPAGAGGAEWKAWIGGYYETHFSCNPIWEAEYRDLPVHPITRGVRPFRTKDEWYFNMRFRDGMTGVTPLLAALAPESTMKRGEGAHAGNPDVRKLVLEEKKPQVVAWAVERQDGGRGFGFTGGHFHKGWANESQRTLVLNAIVWTAKAEVPAAGVASRFTDEELAANQDPKGKPKPKPAATPAPAAK